MKIACCGMIVCDLPMYPVPEYVMSMDLAIINPVKMTTGGDAVNVAKTLNILGAEASLVGRIGADHNGDFVIRDIQSYGLSIDRIIRDADFPTSTSYHLIDPKGKAHTVTYMPINEVLCGDDFHEETLSDAGIVYFGSALTFPKMDRGGIAALFQKAHTAGAKTALDTALAVPATEVDMACGANHLRDLEPALRQTDIFIPSIVEAAYLSGTDIPKENAEIMRKFGIGIFGVKLGSKGCYITDYINEYYIGAFEEFKAVDTVGAGDSFMGAFLFGISKGWDIETSGTFASLVSSFNVASVGSTAGVPDLEKAKAYLADHRCQITKQGY
jgi:Sugar kinases, ribokinase family